MLESNQEQLPELKRRRRPRRSNASTAWGFGNVSDRGWATAGAQGVSTTNLARKQS